MNERLLFLAPQEPHQFGRDLNDLLRSKLGCRRFRKVGPLIKDATEILSGEVGSFGRSNDRDNGESVEGAVAG